MNHEQEQMAAFRKLCESWEARIKSVEDGLAALKAEFQKLLAAAVDIGTDPTRGIRRGPGRPPKDAA